MPKACAGAVAVGAGISAEAGGSMAPHPREEAHGSLWSRNWI